MKEVVRL